MHEGVAKPVANLHSGLLGDMRLRTRIACTPAVMCLPEVQSKLEPGPLRAQKSVLHAQECGLLP